MALPGMLRQIEPDDDDASFAVLGVPDGAVSKEVWCQQTLQQQLEGILHSKQLPDRPRQLPRQWASWQRPHQPKCILESTP